MKVDLTLLPEWVRERVAACPDCYTKADGTAVVCGWHENLAAAARFVGTVATDLEGAE
jgi:hypothetical protein